MSGLLIGMLPVVTETATAVGSGVAEFTGSELIGGAARAGVLGTIANEGDSLATGAIDTIFGQGTVSGIEEKINKTFQDVLKTGVLSGINDGISFTDEKQIVKNLIKNDIKIPQEVGKFISEVGTVIKNDPNTVVDDVVKQVSKQNPLFYYLGSLLDFTSGLVIPNNELYREVSAVYNANNFYDKLTIFENGVYSFNDETGNKVYWDTAWNTYTPIPPLFGTYVGYSSPNNDFPLRYNDENGRLRESVLDSIAMSHDQDYKTISLFSKLADYKLISRIQAQKDKMILPNEREVANVAVNYFSTLGNITRKFFGTDESEEALLKKLYRDIKGIEVTDEQIQNDFQEVSQVVYSESSNELVDFINSLEIQIN